ncbi:MAG TPA: nucleotide exchange factor GrpE [Coxiellaceae bacterium]|nr:nucleotide exchange factor GrpE [Coxiellaceae bacterium]
MGDKKMNEEKKSMGDTVLPETPVSDSKLQDQLTALEIQVNEYKDQMLRVQAEMENVRRRSEQAVVDAHKFGSTKLIQDFLPVVDSLHRALSSEPVEDSHVKNMRKGIELTLDMLIKTLEKHGVKILEPRIGEEFNPEHHQAVSMVLDEKAKPHTILQVLEKGYLLNGRVVRAAMVVVVQG